MRVFECHEYGSPLGLESVKLDIDTDKMIVKV